MRLPSPVLSLLLLPALALSGAPAFAADKREVQEKNFTWQLPGDDWSFVEPEPSLKEAGYVLGAQCSRDGGIRAFVRVVPAEGLSAQDVAAEIKTQMAKGLGKLGASQVGGGRLSGLSSALVSLSGEQAGGTPWWFRAWVVQSGDLVHQLLVEAFGGAEAKRGSAIESLRRGYRLIDGGGPDEGADEPKFHAEDPMAGGPGRADFPPGGPKLEGRTAVFPSHNLRWTLPEGSPFVWQNATENEKEQDQRILEAAGRQERKSEGPGDPDATLCVVSAYVHPLKAGVTAEGVVQNPGNQELFVKAIFDGKIDNGRTKIDTERKVGNHTGASLTLAGGEDKTAKVFVFVVVALRQTLYEWRVQMVGGKDVTKVWGEAVAALFNAIEFPDTVEPVAGPVAVDGIGPFGGARGHSLDKEIDRPIPGAVAKKPKGVAEVPLEGGDPATRLTWEARSADGKGYLWFDVRSWSLSDRGVAQRKLEDWVVDRESQWKAGAGSDAITGKGKQAWSDGSFGSAKGVTYKFTGSFRDHPFLEQGWVVKVKSSVLFLRVQFGGEGAEKTMDGVFKAVKKGVKFQ